MNKIIVILLFTFFNVNAQNDNEKKRDLLAKNNIHEILTYEYNDKGDSTQIGRDIYDKNGNLLEDLRLENGKVAFKYLIEYNEKNLMTKQTGYKENGDVYSILLYEYDDNGNQITYKQVKEDGDILNHQKRIYNSRNENIELYNLVKEKNEFVLSFKFIYNALGLYQSIQRFNSKEQLVSYSDYEYKDGNLTKIASQNSKEKYKILFYYDDWGRNIEKKYNRKKEFTVNGNTITVNQWKERFEYDVENNLISKVTSGNGLDLKIEKYFYIKHKQ